MIKLLIVDDDSSVRFVLKEGLMRKGFEVHTAQCSSEGLKLLSNNSYTLAFFDILMPDEDGLTLLEKAKKIDPDLMIVIMTAQDRMKNAITAMQKGAYDYITKPFDFDELYILIDRALELTQLKEKLTVLNTQVQDNFDPGEIIGRSKEMQTVYKFIGRAASTTIPILITGESGTGKELVAKAIHKNSLRKNNPFITVNCAAIPKDLMESEMFGHEKGAFSGAFDKKAGKFQCAHRGTIFLDEIGDMDLQLQAKILRVLQEKEFVPVGGSEPRYSDVRVISATNVILSDNIEKGLFRDDLYHRLCVLNIHLPSLRERKNDIPYLVSHFLKKAIDYFEGDRSLSKKDLLISEEALHLLTNYDFPGNVRELENVIKRAVILSPLGPITKEHLPKPIKGNKEDSQNNITDLTQWETALKADINERIIAAKEDEEKKVYDAIIHKVEKILIREVLSSTGHNKIKASGILGINRNTLAKKIKELKIDP